MKLFIGADHRGFRMKEQLKAYLTNLGHEIVDMGAMAANHDDDFVDYAEKVALHVSEDLSTRGILVCGSGVGMAITANKIPHIRCAVGHSVDEIRSARHDDDINVLSLAADFLSVEQMQDIIAAFLTTDFAQDERYRRRIAKIGGLERHA